MNIALNRLDPNLPDPVESRRRAAGRMVRAAYTTIVFGVLAFIVIYFGQPLRISERSRNCRLSSGRGLAALYRAGKADEGTAWSGGQRRAGDCQSLVSAAG